MGFEPIRGISPADFGSSGASALAIPICSMARPLEPLSVVVPLSVLRVHLFESSGLGGASFSPKSPQDSESAISEATVFGAVSVGHTGGTSKGSDS